MDGIYLDIRNDEELQEIFKQEDFISIDKIRDELIKLYNDLKREYSQEDNEDLYEDYKLGLL